MLITSDETLIDLASGRSCDTVVDFSELFAGEINNGDAPWSRILLVADSVTVLRAMLPQLVALPYESKVFEVVVGGLPKRELVRLPHGSVGIRAVVTAEQDIIEEPVPHARYAVRFRGVLPLADPLAAMLEGGSSTFQRPAAGLRVGIEHDAADAMPWVCGDPSAVRFGGSMPAGADGPFSVDVVLTSGDAAPAGKPSLEAPVMLAVGGPARRPSWRDLVDAPRGDVEAFVARAQEPGILPPVDTDTLRPVGFRPDVENDEVRLRRLGGCDVSHFAFDGPGEWTSAHFDDWSGLSDRVVDELRGFRAVHDDPQAHQGPVQHAAFLAQAATAALPIVTSGLGDTVRRLLGEPLARELSAVTQRDLADPVRREAYAMSIRRLAFARHGTRGRWASVSRQLGRWTRPSVTVSVILPTKRPELLARIAEQLRRQTWPEVELVLGLHGIERGHPRVRELEAAYDRPLVIAEVPTTRSLGDMLNDLCDLASGELVAKMDDDDWYSEHHLTDLVHAAEYSRADLVGSGAEFLYLEALDLTVRRHRTSGHRYTNRVPGATLLMPVHTLRGVGGWRPLHRAVDTALAHAVTQSGGSIYRTHGLGIVVYRAAWGHTWDPGVEYFLRGDVHQWPGFAPPPGILGAAPSVASAPSSWFDQPRDR
ncbi:glycosyltransferase family 2 protein [Jiangella ureilytica]|uniref:Glycosyltransferase family 2 protein n=1 Tax=Jiangella ureilytica TaxID=2530374 RepID=A0A4R4RXD4_9ACTN|nr:glycosyltransferase family A protein [Jiangella ureilytica]TDC54426.1 glycosyltransferase family 2 protein [Jiangella ureilytica]